MRVLWVAGKHSKYHSAGRKLEYSIITFVVNLLTDVLAVMNGLFFTCPQPVRRHFETDPEAKALLARIHSYKREDMVLERASDSNLRRLKATDGSKPVFVVFAPAVEGDWKACFILAGFSFFPHGVSVHSVWQIQACY